MSNSKKKCKHCGAYKRDFITVPAGTFCSTEHAIEWVNKKMTDGRKMQADKKAKQQSKAKADHKKNDKPKQRDMTKKMIQRWVNHVRDAEKACICCGVLNNSQYCGGHYKTAGAHPELALDSRNIHRQRNRHCNQQKSGNISGDKKSHGYTEGLIKRYGQERVDWLNSYHPPKKYTCEQLVEIRAYYSKLIREGITDDSDCPHR